MTGAQSIAVVPHTSPDVLHCAPSPTFPDEWQLAYTVARHEKAVAAQLKSRGISALLPLYKAVHQWNKRIVTLDLPLFPSYIFLHCDESNRYAVVTTPGIVNLVKFQGKPATVAHDELIGILNALKYRDAYPCPYLAVGKRVRIATGPLAGVVGVVDRLKGLRVIVSVDSIASSIAILAEASDLASAN